MENNKYYTPEIEEFCVGFECEMKNSSHHKYFDWEKCVFKNDFSNELSEDYCFEYLQTDLKEGNIRVKYLDNADVKKCGFISITTEGTQRFKKYVNLKQFEDGEWFDHYLLLSLRYFENVPYISIKKIDIHTYEEEVVTSNDVKTEYLFQGYVKNKNELNKILKQIRLYGDTIESSGY